MDKNVMFTEEKRAERAMEALRSNRMDAYFVKTSEEAAELVKNLIPEGSVCRVGGSRTLHETGIIKLLEEGMANVQKELKLSQKNEKIQHAYDFDENQKGSIVNYME